MESLPLDNELIGVDHIKNNLIVVDEDSEVIMIYKTYRKKMQKYLHDFHDFNPTRLLKNLPDQYLHERALVLSRLGEYEKVISIYIHQLNDLQLAESYCDRIYNSILELKSKSSLNSNENKVNSQFTSSPTYKQQSNPIGFVNSYSFSAASLSLLDNAGEIYLILFKVRIVLILFKN